MRFFKDFHMKRNFSFSFFFSLCIWFKIFFYWIGIRDDFLNFGNQLLVKALTKYKRPKLKRDAQQKCSLFLDNVFYSKKTLIVIYCRTGDNRELKNLLMKPSLILYYYYFSYQAGLVIDFWFVFLLHTFLSIFFCFLFHSFLFFFNILGVSCLVSFMQKSVNVMKK